jgi:hypothetical protein
MVMNQINVTKIQKELPIFTIDLSNHIEELELAKQGIFEEYQKNPISIESNVKAHFVSNWATHMINPNFEPLAKLIVSCTEFVSKEYFTKELKFRIHNMWGMLYDENDYTLKHNHYPSLFACAIYIDVEDNSAPIIFENDITIHPKKATMVLFPAILDHEVPKTSGRRIVISANIDIVGD